MEPPQPETCYRHPERPAVEHCETCQRPVCGSCLWYAETGERLCPDDAAALLQAGRSVTSPARYAEGIADAEAAAARPAPPSAPYQGNSTDVAGLVAALAGASGLLACLGFYWALPLVAFALGLVAWMQSRDAVSPGRTRWLAGAGLAGGGIFLLGFLGMCMMMALCWMAVLLPALSGSGGFATPAPFPTPVPFPTPMA